MPELLVRGGSVIGAEGAHRADVLVEDGVVRAIGADLDPPPGAQLLDATGCLVGPGLVDLHTHLRQPGTEEAETVESGARAAALGGYTAVVAMPNTEPAIDSAPVARDVLELGRKACCVVAVAGTITLGRLGEQLAPMAEMAALGVRIFTDDGRGVQDAGLMRRALEYSVPLGVLLAEHCEDESLSRGGHMHEGAWSSRLGIPGQPALAEEAMVARDIALARLTGARLHLMHLSTAGSVELVRAAKASGLAVSAEATPHHLVLTDGEVASYDPLYKVNPPLRTADDAAAIRRALADGTIDAVATDHAPHSPERKEEPFDMAPPGMTGLATAASVLYTALVAIAAEGQAPAGDDPQAGWAALAQAERPRLELAQIFALMSARPALIAGLDDSQGLLAVGRPANICVFDPTASWVPQAGALGSRSYNAPFAGRRLCGRVRHTIYAGEVVVLDCELQR